MISRLNFKDNHIEVDQYQWDVRFNILDALLYDDYVLIILDYMSFPRGHAASNLEAYTLDGKKIWVADNPSTCSADAYVSFMQDQLSVNGEIVVWNFACFICTIRVRDGKLLSAEFTK